MAYQRTLNDIAEAANDHVDFQLMLDNPTNAESAAARLYVKNTVVSLDTVVICTVYWNQQKQQWFVRGYEDRGVDGGMPFYDCFTIADLKMWRDK